uniref:Uncharacterized protein n=1 Tax=Cyprinus carpio TaxID=7962 RepID=A0A8C1RIR3_CYPCA
MPRFSAVQSSRSMLSDPVRMQRSHTLSVMRIFSEPMLMDQSFTLHARMSIKRVVSERRYVLSARTLSGREQRVSEHRVWFCDKAKEICVRAGWPCWSRNAPQTCPDKYGPRSLLHSSLCIFFRSLVLAFVYTGLVPWTLRVHDT